MSYILEALKKAQAERQLGSAPNIHAPQPVPPSNAAGAGLTASRKPLLLGLGAGALVVVAGAALLWHRAPGTQAAAVTAPQTTPPPALATPQSVGAPGAAPAAAASAAGSGASATLAVSAPDAPPRPARAPDARAPAPHAGNGAQPDGRPDPRAVASVAIGGQPSAAPRAPQPNTAQPTAVAPSAAPTAARQGAPEDSLPLLQQLPESVQSQIPRVSFGGSMYSSNPADRLLLVDKGLRHEGEEIAPGLVLEKLLPRSAVLNFRGVRYRVGL